jgi:hypothetical protein
LFGFEKARKAKELQLACMRVKGMSLVEVIEEYGDPVEPTIRFDQEIAEGMKTHIDELERKGMLKHTDFYDVEEELLQYCNDNDLNKRARDMYHAWGSCHGLRICVAIELSSEFLVKEEGYVEDYFFSYFLGSIVSEELIIPILFPALKGGNLEDFGISYSDRNKLIDKLFSSRLRDLDHFRSIINDFVMVHPYFREHPVSCPSKTVPKIG